MKKITSKSLGTVHAYTNIFKNKKGITLVALAVTIIVLLILSSITINMILGEEGIFNKANYARDKYENAANEEKKQIEDLEDISYINDTSNQSIPEIQKFEGDIGIIKISAFDDKNKIIAYSVTDDIDKNNFINWDGNEITINVENNKILFLKVKNNVGNIISKKFQIHQHQGNSNEEGICYNIPTYHVHTGSQTNGTGCYTKKETITTFEEINFYKAVPVSTATISELTYSYNSIRTYYQDQTNDRPIYTSNNRITKGAFYIISPTGFHTTQSAAMSKSTQVSDVFYTSSKTSNSNYFSSIDSAPSYTYYTKNSTTTYSLGCDKDEDTVENYQLNCEYENGELIVY